MAEAYRNHLAAVKLLVRKRPNFEMLEDVRRRNRHRGVPGQPARQSRWPARGEIAVDHAVHVQDVALLARVEPQPGESPRDFMPRDAAPMLA